MSENDDKYRVYLDGETGQDPHHPQPERHDPHRRYDAPFCLGIVGDFSGRGTRPEEGSHLDLPQRPLHRVTPENAMDFAGIRPKIVVTGLADYPAKMSLAFRAMDDFHPDSLFGRLDLFQKHRDARAELSAGPQEGQREESTPPTSHPGPGPGLLDAVLGETEREAPPTGSVMDEELDAFIRRVVKPHRVGAAPDHSEALGALDLQTSHLMKALMNSPAFKEMEALWRSVVFLLSRVEVSTNLRVYLIDVSEEELVADLLSSDEPEEWGFAHTVLAPVSENGEELRWAGLLGAFRFGGAPHHIPLLQRIGLVAESGGIPWFAGADASLLGSSSVRDQPDPRDWDQPLDPLWEELRGRAEAECLNLSFPRFLLRNQYGAEGGRVKRFNFEEKAEFPVDLLWGNSCFLIGIVLARAFARSGWEMQIVGREPIPQLPIHATFDGWGASLEVTLSHSAASRLFEMGLSPIITSRGDPTAQLLGCRSVSIREEHLKSWWKGPV